ncbi:MAG: FkbM family methyltransferase [bacterium]|nr:FkbM family methyltransferase [bacterium]
MFVLHFIKKINFLFLNRFLKYSRLLDFFGGRFILAKLITFVSKKMSAVETELFYKDGLWIHRVDRVFFPDGPRFYYFPGLFQLWVKQKGEYIRNAKEFWFAHYTPKYGDTILDIGAGRGEDTFTFSKAVGKTGKIIGIEADPHNFQMLEKFCSLNELRNTTLHQVALMDKPGCVSMHISTSWIDNAITDNNEEGDIFVPSDTLDNICALEEINDIAFLKMNIEGAERFALLGMGETLKKVKIICIACHDFLADRGGSDSMRTRSFVVNFLRTHGFKVIFNNDEPRDFARDHIFALRN